jgi:hypothetical protein
MDQISLTASTGGVDLLSNILAHLDFHITHIVETDGCHCVCSICPDTHTCKVMTLCMRCCMYIDGCHWVCSIYPYVHICMTICMCVNMHACVSVRRWHPSIIQVSWYHVVWYHETCISPFIHVRMRYMHEYVDSHKQCMHAGSACLLPIWHACLHQICT